MNLVFSMTSRMRWLALMCVGLLFGLLFLLGLQIGARMAESQAPHKASLADRAEAKPKNATQTLPAQDATASPERS